MCEHTKVFLANGLPSDQLNDFGEQVLAMEFCSEENLQEMIDSDSNSNGLSSSEFFRVCEDLVSAMEYLHKMKLVHQNVAMENRSTKLNF